NTRTNPAGLAGRYTVVLPGSANNDAQAPNGDGFATLTVTPAGAVVCTIALADGSKASQSSYLSPGAQCPLYLPLYRGHGQLLGWLNFTNADPASVVVPISWIEYA